MHNYLWIDALACLLLYLSIIASADEAGHRLIFPPFSSEDLKGPGLPLSEHLSYEELKAMPVEELRGVLSMGNFTDRRTATKELVERGDQKTILRLVYSLRQGNVGAEMLLAESPSLAAVPYSMEDVAHGSLEYHGTFRSSDATFGSGRVRVAAVKRVADILANSPEFSGETSESLKAICSGRESLVQTLSDQSRYLVEWWHLNEDAFEAGKWESTRPLPYRISYPHPKDDKPLPHEEPMEVGKQPPVGSPAWELSEPFEAWAERIVDPSRRNLDFVALSWDGTKVIEHPAKSLDPRAKLKDRETRRTPAPRNLQDSNDATAGVRATPWMFIVASLMVLVVAAIWWMRRKPAMRI
jgi:hypothetical protein